MKTIYFILFLFLSSSILAQQNDFENVVNDTLSIDYELFTNENPLKISLKADFKKFKREKMKGAYHDAELIYFIDDSISVNNKVKIKARGKNRKETCIFPPISINLKKMALNGNTFRFYKLKMVVHCNYSKIFEKFLLKEYLCYQLYSSLNVNSFKVRLLDVDYVDTGTKKQKSTRMYAFLIEDQEMMAERLSATLDKNEKLTQKHINQENIIQLAMFQFMIGNFDWAVPTQQNLKLIRPKSNIFELLAVPYDFDYCGMVNASYAIPNEELGIHSVLQRIYLGECLPKEDFLPIIEKFLKHKPVFYSVIQSFEYFDDKEKQGMIKYLDEFYKMLDHKDFYKNYIQKTCKQIGG